MKAVPGKLYRHQKGGMYRVSCLAKHTETGEELVVYESISTGDTWARPREMFEGERNGKPRFTLVE